DGSRFVFRAKSGVLSNVDFALPGEPDDGEEEGHFTVAHSMEVWPGGGTLMPGSHVRVSTLVVNRLGRPATEADYGHMTVRLDPTGGDPLGALSLSPRPACPDLTGPLSPGGVFLCALIDTRQITQAEICAISGNRISG